MTFLDKIKDEIKNANKIRMVMNYIIVPIYLTIMILILITVLITMNINEEKYTPLAIILFSFIGLVSLGLLISVPFVRKKEINIELSKYNFDTKYNYTGGPIELKPLVGINNENQAVSFNSEGISINDKLYKYNDLDISFVTSNYLKLINLRVEFVIKGTEEEYDPYLLFKLDEKMLFIINEFNLLIKNKNVLDYVLNNKVDSFKQIYTYGYVKNLNK